MGQLSTDAGGLDDNQEDQEDEKPTVVVLNEGDLTAEEAKEATKHLTEGMAY